MRLNHTNPRAKERRRLRENRLSRLKLEDIDNMTDAEMRQVLKWLVRYVQNEIKESCCK